MHVYVHNPCPHPVSYLRGINELVFRVIRLPEDQLGSFTVQRHTENDYLTVGQFRDSYRLLVDPDTKSFK